MIVEMDTKTPDAPYGDHFSVKETWIVVSSSFTMQKCIFTFNVNIVFVKNTMFKNTII